MQIYGVGTSRDGNVQVQWEVLHNMMTDMEFSPEFIKKLGITEDQAEQIAFEVAQAVSNAFAMAILEKEKHNIPTRNNSLEDYWQKIKDQYADIKKRSTWAEYCEFNREMALEDLMYKYYARDETELMRRISPEDKEEYKDYLPTAEELAKLAKGEEPE